MRSLKKYGNELHSDTITIREIKIHACDFKILIVNYIVQ